MNAAGREVRIRAGAASRVANVSLLLRAGGCEHKYTRGRVVIDDVTPRRIY